jgi:tRNA(Leu) C34 or U34 (ribose-2'-O)-methylase TrmL
VTGALIAMQETVTPNLAGAPFLVFGRQHTTPLTPAVILEDPKSPWNVALVIRAAWAFGIPQVWISGGRVTLDAAGPRPTYEDAAQASDYVSVVENHDPLAAYVGRRDTDVIAVERGIHPPAARVGAFRHAVAAVYVFGPEDGRVSPATLARADDALEIPSRHALNLALAVGIVLADRTRGT